jgi:hypothetical protein
VVPRAASMPEVWMAVGATAGATAAAAASSSPEVVRGLSASVCRKKLQCNGRKLLEIRKLLFLKACTLWHEACLPGSVTSTTKWESS